MAVGIGSASKDAELASRVTSLNANLDAESESAVLPLPSQDFAGVLGRVEDAGRSSMEAGLASRVAALKAKLDADSDTEDLSLPREAPAGGLESDFEARVAALRAKLDAASDGEDGLLSATVQRRNFRRRCLARARDEVCVEACAYVETMRRLVRASFLEQRAALDDRSAAELLKERRQIARETEVEKKELCEKVYGAASLFCCGKGCALRKFGGAAALRCL